MGKGVFNKEAAILLAARKQTEQERETGNKTWSLRTYLKFPSPPVVVLHDKCSLSLGLFYLKT